MKLPDPECKYGYPVSQLRSVLGYRLSEFREWHAGQTGVICDGMAYDTKARKYVATGCGPHGAVVYVDDVERFLEGLGPLD